jgi:hypothetical protein
MPPLGPSWTGPALLAQYGNQIEPATAPIKTLEDLTAYGTAHGIDLTPKIKPVH